MARKVPAMRASDDIRQPKKPVNISINSSLLAAARELNINLSATMEAALTEAVKHKQRDLWLAQNRAAIAAYNERVETEGVFSDGVRRF
jgi:antitoxin CcdA